MLIFGVDFCSSLCVLYTRQRLRSVVVLHKSTDNAVESAHKRCPKGSFQSVFLRVACKDAGTEKIQELIFGALYLLRLLSYIKSALIKKL